ncbi:hypothetical protein EMEDMD4_750017 [Sinorhizobium medicae]|uniref:Uncharacterized protein n=1 Tax=Sinorhizobium medicae TaxID=110321 RepID=A0A508X584_9HYPH|nr:hypothetical protein EMEDMD4_750017 [Sinorhizobium medicae]
MQSQSHSLTMTPQLMQSIQLLQIGHLELSGALGRRHRRRPQVSISAGARSQNIAER